MGKAILMRSLPWDVVEDDVPILYEQDNKLMGETPTHARTNDRLFYGIEDFLKRKRPAAGIQCFRDANAYYADEPVQAKTGNRPCFAADVMGVKIDLDPAELTSYTIGRDGPVPCLLAEILSEGTAEDNDLDKKVTLYARLGVDEYILVDPTGTFLPERLLLKRLQPDGTWLDCRDEDGGVTSQLGFRIVFEGDKLYVLDARTGKRFVPPDDAESAREEAARKLRQAERKVKQAAEARRLAEEKAREEAKARLALEERNRALEVLLQQLQAKDAPRPIEGDRP